MNLKMRCLRVAALGVSVAMLPTVLSAQMGDNANSNQQNMNEPAGPPTRGGPPANQPMPDSLGAPGLTGQQMMDKSFLREVAAGEIAQAKIAELVEQKGSPDVKAFAQKVSDAHTQIAKDMENTANRLGVILPKKMNRAGREEYAKLEGLSGKAFDTEYVTFMITSHRRALHDFRVEAATAADEGLATEAVRISFVVRRHLTAALELAKNDGIPVPPRPEHHPRPGRIDAAR